MKPFETNLQDPLEALRLTTNGLEEKITPELIIAAADFLIKLHRKGNFTSQQGLLNIAKELGFKCEPEFQSKDLEPSV